MPPLDTTSAPLPEVDPQTAARDRALAVYNGMRERGLPHADALGWAANSVVESGSRPDGPRSSTGAAGTFQWLGPRLQAYRDLYGHEPEAGTLDEHLDHVLWENQNTEQNAAKAIASAPNDPVAKAQVIRTAWERPGRSPEETAAEAGKAAGAARWLMSFIVPSAEAAEPTASTQKPTISSTIQGARAAGYSDADIWSRMAGSKTFGPVFEQARKAGYNDQQIQEHYGLKAAPAAAADDGRFEVPGQPQVDDDADRFAIPEAAPTPQRARPAAAPSPAPQQGQRMFNGLPMAEEDHGSAPPPVAGAATPAVDDIGRPIPGSMPPLPTVTPPAPTVDPNQMVAPGEPPVTQQSLAGAALNAPFAEGIKSVGQIAGAAPQFAAGMAATARTGAGKTAETILKAADQIDAGNVSLPTLYQGLSDAQKGLVFNYLQATPDQRKEMRAEFVEQASPAVAQTPGAFETGAANLAHAITTKADVYAAQKAPVDPEYANHWLTKTTGMLGGFVPQAAAAVVGGMPAFLATSFAQGYESTAQQALQKGATPEMAHAAAMTNGLVSAGLMAVPAAQWLGHLTPEVQGPIANMAAALATHSGTMVGISQVQTLADNLIAKQTYEPNRPLSQGLGQDIPEQALVGALIPGGMAAARNAGPALRNLANRAVPSGPTMDFAPPPGPPGGPEPASPYIRPQLPGPGGAGAQPPPGAPPGAPPSPSPSPPAPAAPPSGEAALADIAAGRPTTAGTDALNAMAQGKPPAAAPATPTLQKMAERVAPIPPQPTPAPAPPAELAPVVQEPVAPAAPPDVIPLPQEPPKPRSTAQIQREDGVGHNEAVRRRDEEIAAQPPVEVAPGVTVQTTDSEAPAAPSPVERLPQQILMMARESGAGSIPAGRLAPAERDMLEKAGLQPYMDEETGELSYNTYPLEAEAQRRIKAGAWDNQMSPYDNSHLPAAAPPSPPSIEQAVEQTVKAAKEEAQPPAPANPRPISDVNDIRSAQQIMDEDGVDEPTAMDIQRAEIDRFVKGPETPAVPATSAPDPTAVVGTPEFKSWFSGSKIFDGDGDPMIVHHFTYNEFENFDRTWAANKFKRDPEGIDTVGVWFTDNPDMKYASPDMGGRRMDAYLSVKRPLYLVDNDGIPGGDAWSQLRALVKDAGGSTAFRADLKTRGYDGIVLNGTMLDGKIQNAIVALEPDQIKVVKSGPIPRPEVTPPKAAETKPAEPEVVEHTTPKGKVLQGIVTKDMTLAQAKEIDPFTFKKDGGFFIRKNRWDAAQQAAAPAAAPPTTPTTPTSDLMKLPIGEVFPRDPRVMPTRKGSEMMRTPTGWTVGDNLSRPAEATAPPAISPPPQPAPATTSKSGALTFFKGDRPVTIHNQNGVALKTAASIATVSPSGKIIAVDRSDQRGLARFYRQGNTNTFVENPGSGPAGAILNDTIVVDVDALRAPPAETPPAPPTEHPGLIIKSLETGKETHFQPPGTVPPSTEQAAPGGESAGASTEKPEASTGEGPDVGDGSDNKFFTKDRFEAARARMRDRLNRLSSGFDPGFVMDGLEIAGYHVERGLRKFADYSKAMVDDLGDGIKPHLANFYRAVRDFHGFDNKGMDDDATIAAELTRMAERPTSAAEAGNEPGHLDQPSTGPLAHIPTDEVQGAPVGGETRPGAEGSGGANAPGDVGTGGHGLQAPGSVGDGQGEVPVPAGGEGGQGAQQPVDEAVPGGDRGQQSRVDATGEGPSRTVAPDSTPTAGTPAGGRGDNFVHAQEDEIGKGGNKTKYRANVAAIRLLRELDASNDPATREQQAILSKWVGWGALADAFPRDDGSAKVGWEKEVAELKSLLTPEEFQEASASSRNAHYTSPEVVKGMWDAMQRMGFNGGRLLEPSVGIGNFFGLMPRNLRQATALNGVERDTITSGLAKYLYPKAKIARMPFQDYIFPEGHFDAVVGNPPFGAEKLYDPQRRDLAKFSIHNYFFARSIDGLKPGGVMSMVVTNRLLDGGRDEARKYISDRADLVGAIRLPNNAFKKNAGTEVTTDILFFRKRMPGEAPSEERWMDARPYTDRAGKTVPLNEYFHKHPEMMLGEFGAYGSMRGPDEPALVARPGQDTTSLLSEAIKRLPENIASPMQHQVAIEGQTPSRDVSNVRVGSVFVDGKHVMQRMPDILGEQRASPVEFDSAKAEQRVRGLISVRDALTNLRTAQLDPKAEDGDLVPLRQALNAAYDQFVKDHGPVNLDANKRLFRDDPSWPQVSALEDNFQKGISAAVAAKTGEQEAPPSAKKAAIFTSRTQSPYRAPESAASAKDALAASLAERGLVDLNYMRQLYRKSDDEIVRELGDLVYNDPQASLTTKDEYLSGNVKQKLAQARQAAAVDPAYQRNVEALEAVQPEDIEPVRISVKPGATWLTRADMRDFVAEVLGSPRDVSVNFNPTNARWSVSGRAAESAQTRFGVLDQNGISRASVAEVVEAAANQLPLVIRDSMPDGGSVINAKLTSLAKVKVQAVTDAFSQWIWRDEERRDRLARVYNDTFNTDVKRVFDGSHLLLPGKVGNDVVNLRPTQMNAVWRIVAGQRVLLDHVVGAGKTYTIIAGAMELRRMGFAKKPMIAVPNHLIGQWAADFSRLYPNANVLAANKDDFKASNRKRLFARIATGDWDAVIVPHSSLARVDVEPRFVGKFIDEQISDLEQSRRAVAAVEGKGSRNVKQIQDQIAKLTEKMKKLLDAPRKDDSLYWGELGIDALMVDEAHEFKNLAYSTSMGRVAGLGTQKGSQKAFDLFVKTRHVLEATGDRNVVFATGTPISNTMAEMYTMQRYLDYKDLKAQGLSHFDAWARQYGQVTHGWELSPAGTLKMNSRFSKFVNLPELMQRYMSFADVINRNDINESLKASGQELPVPKVAGGKPAPVINDRSEYQAAYIGVPIKDENGDDTDNYPAGSLIWRSENLPKGPPQKGDDNMLKIMSDARKAALDYRLIDPSAPDVPNSKVNVAVRLIKDIYDQSTPDKGAQLVFCDLSTPKNARADEAERIRDLIRRADEGDDDAQEALDNMSPDELDALNSKFSVYDDMKAKLIRSGIPASEIAFIHDAKTDLQKAELFGKVRSGRVRILMGSTQKMGAGMNVQERLVALHHMDAPWRPSDLEQREGRIIRQGNVLRDRDPENFAVQIMRYATKDTLDARMWQVLESKANFIEQVRAGATGLREADDVSGEAANSAEMKAASSGNPMILEEMELRRGIRDLEAQQQGYVGEQHRIQSSIKRSESAAVGNDQKAAQTTLDIDKVPQTFGMTIEGKAYAKRADAGAAISTIAKAMLKASGYDNTAKAQREIGTYGGFPMTLDQWGDGFFVTLSGEARDYEPWQRWNPDGVDPGGLVQRITNMVSDLPAAIEGFQNAAEDARQEAAKLRSQVEEWPRRAQLEQLRQRHTEVVDQLQTRKGRGATIEEGGGEPSSGDGQFVDQRAEAPAEGHGDAANWVVSAGRESGHEHSAIIDNKTGKVVDAGTKGHGSEVDVPVGALEGDTDAYTVHHNHPRGTALSASDLSVLAYPGISHIVAHDHEGHVSMASIGPRGIARSSERTAEMGRQNADRLMRIEQRFRARTREIVYSLIGTGVLDPKAGAKYFDDFKNRLMNGLGVINYRSSYQMPSVMMDALKSELLNEEVGRGTLPFARSTQSIRPDQRAEGLHQGVREQPRSEPATGPGRADLSEAGSPDRAASRGINEDEGGLEPRPGDTLYSFPGMLFDPATWNRAARSLEPAARPVGRAIVSAAEAARNVGRSIAHGLVPMSTGTVRAQAFAADFANALRQVQYRFGEIDRELERGFTPIEREAMARAMDAQSVFEQQLRDVDLSDRAEARRQFDAGGTGVAGLPTAQQQVLEWLDKLSQDTWRQMQEREMVPAEAQGLPYYFPRQIIGYTEGEGFSRIASFGAGSNKGIDRRGLNLTTAGPMQRKHLTPEETEAAARAKLGNQAVLLRDIRSLPQRLAYSQRAVAGVDLMNQIKTVGEETGVNLVVRGDIPGDLVPGEYFTMADHPSFRRWTGTGWQALHVSKEFEGPLRAVLTQSSGAWYQAAQKLKGGVMSAIMFSPFIHLAVEVGRSLPADPMGVLTLRAFRDGSRLRRDLDYMDQATRDGVAPIGHTGGWSIDPVSIADQQNAEGRNRFIRALASARDAVANGARRIGGQTLHDIMQHPHQTLLWDQVFNLQVGLYDHLRSKWIADGYSPEVAGTMAAHIANRYAGALPPEHLSKAANMAANLLLFSRSFTLGNLGVMKDLMNGAPAHIRARIEQMTDPETAKSAQNTLRRKAIAAFVMDIGLFYLTNALLQWGIQALRQGVGAAADDWWEKAKWSLGEASKGDLLSIFGVLPQHWNEPGKQDRVYAGTDTEGRGIYLRLPTGKVGEEFLGWFTKPGVMLVNKMSPLTRPIIEDIFGHDSLGRDLYPPNPQGVSDYLRIGGLAAKHIVEALGPTATIEGVRDLWRHHVSGEPSQGDPGVSAAKVLGPATGLAQVSSGYPGGPQAGEIHAFTERQRFELQQAMPDIRKSIKNGDTEGALAKMQALGVPPGLQKYYIRQTNTPGASAKQTKQFLEHASPEQLERFGRGEPQE